MISVVLFEWIHDVAIPVLIRVTLSTVAQRDTQDIGLLMWGFYITDPTCGFLFFLKCWASDFEIKSQTWFFAYNFFVRKVDETYSRPRKSEKNQNFVAK